MFSITKHVCTIYRPSGRQESGDVERYVTAGPEGLYTPPEAALATTNEYNLLQQNVKASSLQHKMAIKKLADHSGGGYAYENLLGKGSIHSGWDSLRIRTAGGDLTISSVRKNYNYAMPRISCRPESVVVMRMKHTWDDLNDAYKCIKIALLSIEQAKENLRLNTDYYAARPCTMSDLLDAQSLSAKS